MRYWFWWMLISNGKSKDSANKCDILLQNTKKYCHSCLQRKPDEKKGVMQHNLNDNVVEFISFCSRCFKISRSCWGITTCLCRRREYQWKWNPCDARIKCVKDHKPQKRGSRQRKRKKEREKERETYESVMTFFVPHVVTHVRHIAISRLQQYATRLSEFWNNTTWQFY